MPAFYEMVDGVRLPARLAGQPALEFCNTRTGWDGRTAGEYLKEYDHLAVWAGYMGLLEPARVAELRREGRRRARIAAGVLDRAWRFRSSLYEVLVGGSPKPAWNLVSGEVVAAAAALRLRRAGNAIHWEVRTEPALAAPLLAVAWSAGELLTSADLEFVRACPGTGCGWLFLDRRGRRRWCLMATCGNREKARRFAARHHAR